MLTPADDFPVHQTPNPVALAIGERNFYDRYFFNGYSEDGETFFAIALGFYPQLGVVDAAFSVQRDGVQHNVRASKEVETMDRLDLSVGPLSVTIETPLRTLKVKVDHDVVQANLEFTARCPAVLEPRFTRRQRGRLYMDYTRMTQNGAWSGQIAVAGDTDSVDGCLGTRDRSWGVRPVGTPDSQPTNLDPQFFWIWAPINFADFATLYHLNADGQGLPWNESGVIVPLLSKSPSTENQIRACRNASSSITVDRESRRLSSMTITLEDDQQRLSIELTPYKKFFMSGLGYTHPSWGHGLAHGDLEVAYDTINIDTVDETEMPFRHIQALCTARVEGRDDTGYGVIEQLFFGPYAPLDL